MPGKYSHSVVLADYSTRGIISLPTDQHVKYVSTSPQAPGRPSSQARARGTRSAQAAPYVSRSDSASWRASTASRPHPSLLVANATTSTGRTRLEVPTEDEPTTFQPMRYSQYYRQMPNSSPNINVASSTRPQEVTPVPPVPQLPVNTVAMSAYQRQQLLNASSGSSIDQLSVMTGRVGHVTETSNRQIDRDSWNPPEVPRYVRSNPNFGRGSSSTAELDAHPSPQLRTGARSPLIEEGPQRVIEPNRIRADLQSTKSPSQRVSDPPPYDEAYRNLNIAKSPALTEMEKQSQQYRPTNNGLNISTPIREFVHSDRTAVSGDVNPQTRTPQSGGSATIGPDFNAFLDRALSPIDNTRADTNSMSQGLIQRNGNTQAANATISSRSNSIRAASANLATSNQMASSSNHKIAKSTSSTNPINKIATSLTAKTHSPSKKSISASLTDRQAQNDRESWQLPEIKENQDFNPSIFEARFSQDESNTVTREDIEHSIGQISSGKDVTFDDAASELSAALPPPISRFRDEEDEFNSNMAKLFGEGGDHAIAKKSSHTFGKSIRKKGFFAKFRSKS